MNKLNKTILFFVVIILIILIVWFFFNREEKNDKEVESMISKEEAIEIADKNEKCLEIGILTENIAYNENTKTWWIDIEMNEEMKKEGCNPACVINEEAKEAEVNWRCTGLIPEE